MSTKGASERPGGSDAEAHGLPGSTGEHLLQEEHGTRHRAEAFYRRQMTDHLNDRMREFISERDMMFVSTADARGNCDCSIRTGPPGFVCVADERTLAYPEYRGNGVMASLGNLRENPHIGLLLVDFFGSTVGCHINGTARAVENEEMLALAAGKFGLSFAASLQAAFDPAERGRRPERWVLVHVEEAYIHCSKHIPKLARQEKTIDWGTDDPAAKGGDFFQVKGLARPWSRNEEG